ncbi:hypothetical protein ACHAXS_012345 [Conticribra weissflogii]
MALHRTQSLECLGHDLQSKVTFSRFLPSLGPSVSGVLMRIVHEGQGGRFEERDERGHDGIVHGFSFDFLEGCDVVRFGFGLADVPVLVVVVIGRSSGGGNHVAVGSFRRRIRGLLLHDGQHVQESVVPAGCEGLRNFGGFDELGVDFGDLFGGAAGETADEEEKYLKSSQHPKWQEDENKSEEQRVMMTPTKKPQQHSKMPPERSTHRMRSAKSPFVSNPSESPKYLTTSSPPRSSPGTNTQSTWTVLKQPGTLFSGTRTSSPTSSSLDAM